MASNRCRAMLWTEFAAFRLISWRSSTFSNKADVLDWTDRVVVPQAYYQCIHLSVDLVDVTRVDVLHTRCPRRCLVVRNLNGRQFVFISIYISMPKIHLCIVRFSELGTNAELAHIAQRHLRHSGHHRHPATRSRDHRAWTGLDLQRSGVSTDCGRSF